MAKKIWLSLVLFLAASFLHPLSAVTLFFCLILSVSWSWVGWRQLDGAAKRLVITWSVALPILAAVIFFWRGRSFVGVAYDYPLDLAHLLQTHFAPLLLLAPVGWFLLFRRPLENNLAKVVILALVFVSILFSLTHVGGLSPIPHRFDSYAILVALIGSSLALPWLSRNLFKTRWWQSFFLIIFFVTLAIASWQANAFVYNFYESPGKYARLHKDELAAIYWLRDNLPAEALIVSTKANRHSEWIPILSGLNWQGLENAAEFSQVQNASHAVFFLNREGIAEQYKSTQPIFRNDGVVVFQLSPVEQP